MPLRWSVFGVTFFVLCQSATLGLASCGDYLHHSDTATQLSKLTSTASNTSALSPSRDATALPRSRREAEGSQAEGEDSRQRDNSPCNTPKCRQGVPLPVPPVGSAITFASYRWMLIIRRPVPKHDQTTHDFLNFESSLMPHDGAPSTIEHIPKACLVTCVC